MDIFVHKDGEQQGPFTLEQVNVLMSQGMLMPTDSAWHEGLNGWVPLGDIQGVRFGTPGMTPQTTGIASQEQQTRKWGMLIHLFCVLPGVGWIASIVLWKIKVQELPGIDVHGKNSANWIISLIIYSAAFYGVINLILALGVMVILKLLVPIQIAMGVVGLILPIIAVIKANNGEIWKNPLTITIIK